MAYVCSNVEQLIGQPAVDNQQCVRLVQVHGGAPAASTWRQGAVVKGNQAIEKGTAIATFVNGRYPNLPSGNHAALYLNQDNEGVWVVDQYFGSNGIHKRLLRFKGQTHDGAFVDPSNNGDAFSIIA